MAKKEENECKHKWDFSHVEPAYNTGELDGYGKCRRCGKNDILKVRRSPFNDKRNFRRTDPRYAEYRKLLKDTYGRAYK